MRGKAASSGWGFPKGKINKGESEVECAVREVSRHTPPHHHQGRGHAAQKTRVPSPPRPAPRPPCAMPRRTQAQQSCVVGHKVVRRAAFHAVPGAGAGPLQVLEETGVDVEALIDANAFIEAKGQNDKLHKLFIVAGINPETTAFAPHLAGVSEHLPPGAPCLSLERCSRPGVHRSTRHNTMLVVRVVVVGAWRRRLARTGGTG